MKENDRLLEKDSNVLENEKANNQNEEDLDKKKMDQALDRLIKTYHFFFKLALNLATFP